MRVTTACGDQSAAGLDGPSGHALPGWHLAAVTESGTFSCPLTGEKERRFRGEWKVIDNDTLSYTMYNPGPDGKEVKGMEISYKRTN